MPSVSHTKPSGHLTHTSPTFPRILLLLLLLLLLRLLLLRVLPRSTCPPPSLSLPPPLRADICKNPILQTQNWAPRSVVVSPALHGLQASAPPVEYSLIPHTRHSECPIDGVKFPTAHNLQSDTRVCPSKSKYVPVGHAGREGLHGGRGGTWMHQQRCESAAMSAYVLGTLI